MPDRPEPGHCQSLEPGVRRVLAPNPSPMTHWGTNTYLIGTGSVAVIDPGPALPTHFNAILAALSAGERITHILVTHAHLDHSPLARPLAQATGAKVFAFGTATAGRSTRMQQLAMSGDAGGGEGLDHGFSPDETLADGDSVASDDWALLAHHTPGHISGHLCFALDDWLFSGDHVMGWASSLISPPDGDMAAYRASLALLAARPWRQFFPAHGSSIANPDARLAFLADHRKQREAAILAALAQGAQTLPALIARVYTDTPKALLPAASRNLLAHLIDLEDRNLIAAYPSLSVTARFSLI
ncbi:MAG: MBL fold metallo-hydrolase [Paracoccaceae bacterium]